MFRSVPFPGTRLRAVALAAVIGGQTSCVRAIPVQTGVNSNATAGSAFAGATAFAASRATKVITADTAVTPRIVVRDYWGSPLATVVAWNDDESWQGLRAAVMRDGTIAFDHILYYNAYAAPSPSAFYRANWYAFNDTVNAGKVLLTDGMLADQFNCQGRYGCSPYITYRARVSEELLRNSHDSLIVKVVSYDGHETTISLRGGLISSYLATVDSLSAVRRARSKSSRH